MSMKRVALLASAFLISADLAVAQATLGLGDRRALQSYQESIFPTQQAAIQKAAGFELPIEVRWDAIALPGQGQNYNLEGFWTNIFFVPLAQALSQVASDNMGKQAVRDKLKKIVLTYDEKTAPASAYENGVKFEGGVLTINFQPFANAHDVEDRAKAIRKRLEAQL
jgi:hypothetical protein